MARSSGKNYLIILLALTTATGGALAWNQYLAGVKLRGQLLNGDARADLEKRLEALQKRRNELEAEVADLRSRETRTGGGDPASVAPEAVPGPRVAGRFGRPNRVNFISNLMEDPQFGKMWADQQKARAAAAFAPLLKTLNLSPDQANHFQSLMAERQMSVMDAIAAARSQGITDRAEMASVVQQATSQVDSQLQALLGPDGYNQYQNFVQTQPQRNQVNQLQLGLISSGNAPLQDSQVQQLTQILAQNSAGSAAGGTRGVFYAEFGGMGGALGAPVTGPPISEAAVNQAASILTPAQVQQLQQMQQEQAAQRQMFDLMRQNFGGGAAQPPAAVGTAGGAAPAPAGPPRG